MATFQKELQAQQTSTNFLKIPYNQPQPEELVRKIAEYQLKSVSARKDDSFW